MVDSKEHLRFRAMCDERISFPFEELREFPDVYAKLEPYVAADSFVEVKVAWRCNTEQWWWAEVPPSQAGPLYKKLGYSDDAIRAFGLDPEGPVGTPFLPAAAPGADPASQRPLMMEYPGQPRPPITVENVNSVMGKKTKKDLKALNKHLFWARTECGLVLSSVTHWEIISKEKRVTTGGYMCNHCQGFWKQGRGATRFRSLVATVPLIAPKLSLSGVDWWTDWVETLKSLFCPGEIPGHGLPDPDVEQGFPGSDPETRVERQESEMAERGLDQTRCCSGVGSTIVVALFRVFIPDCAYQLGIPRTQRQYLGNWQTESTADIYTREKRNVVVDIWGKVLSRLRDINLDPRKRGQGGPVS